MPRVKLDYIVSFSSEDPENPASNLLSWDVSKKRWLCAKGEPSCSVVLQLPRAVKISAVHVGAYHSALVEVLVGRSEKPNEAFQVLVPSCIFLTPAESRKDVGVERVRSFTADQLSASARDQRWDRVRVVCTQPYNKHCKYGLNFVHISEPEGAPSGSVSSTTSANTAAASDAPAKVPLTALLADHCSSSDDEFRPGELFAKHKRPGAADTGAQIRQATSHALKNISDSATKLVKTPISKHSSRQANSDEPSSSNRQRETLMYTDDDDRPHAKIDHIVQRHKDEKSRDEAKKLNQKTDDRKASNEVRVKETSQNEKQKDKRDRTPKNDRNRPDPATPASRSNVSQDEPSTSSSRDKGDKDRKRSRDDKYGMKAGGELSAILKGVTFALSGYANPRRAAVRDQAIEMGARCERDWGPSCNYLICAFPNTPKLKQVRSGPGGATVPAVRAEWVEASHARRRRLPWRWFATEREHQQTPPKHFDVEVDEVEDDEDCDTDDEIEKALRKQKKRRTEDPPTSKTENNKDREHSKRDQHKSSSKDDANVSSASGNTSNTSDVMFVRDERMRGNVSLLDSDDDKTDEEDAALTAERIDKTKCLPDLFSGSTFVIGESAARAVDAALLARYVRAYGGVVIDANQLESDSSVSYVLCTSEESNPPPGAQGVRPAWLWRCHAERRLHPPQEYLVT